MSEDPNGFDSVIDMLTHDCHKYAVENALLKAEVERLRKAGDAMAFNYESMSNAVSVYDCDLMKYVDRWNAAKEGKPSV